MAAVSIDEELNISEEIANFMLFLMNEDRIQLPKLSIPQILLAKGRPGLSAEILSSSIISRFPEAGINIGAQRLSSQYKEKKEIVLNILNELDKKERCDEAHVNGIAAVNEMMAELEEIEKKHSEVLEKIKK